MIPPHRQGSGYPPSTVINFDYEITRNETGEQSTRRTIVEQLHPTATRTLLLPQRRGMEEALTLAIGDAGLPASAASITGAHIWTIDQLLAARGSFIEGPIADADAVAVVATLRGNGSAEEKDARWRDGANGAADVRLLVIKARARAKRRDDEQAAGDAKARASLHDASSGIKPLPQAGADLGRTERLPKRVQTLRTVLATRRGMVPIETHDVIQMAWVRATSTR